MRLVESASTTSTTFSRSGRLEVYMNGRFGTVCDNGFSLTSAEVVCEQLGFKLDQHWNTEVIKQVAIFVDGVSVFCWFL